MDWTSIIEVLIGAGGVTSLFLISERKTAAALKNMQSMVETLQSLYDKQLERYDAEVAKNKELSAENTTLHNSLDAANTKAATATLKRCDLIVCGKRKPPLQDQWCMDIDKPTEEQ